MKLNKYTWIFVGLIAAVYLGTLLWVRVTNPVCLQQNMYRTWEKSYVMHPRADQSFVNTSTNNNHQKPVALEQQPSKTGRTVRITGLWHVDYDHGR